MFAVKRTPRWPDPRVKPPYGSAEIDWGHPLAPSIFTFLFNEMAGPLHDLSHGGRQTTPSAVPPTWGSSVRGVSRVYDGLLNYDDISNTYRGATDYTISAIVQDTNDGTSDCIISLDENNAFPRMQINGGTLGLFDGTTLLNGGTTVHGNDFHHVVATHRGSTISLYVDGRSDVTPASGQVTQSITAAHRIGNTVGVLSFGGQLASLLVHGRALSDTEVLQLYCEPYAFLRPVIRRRYFFQAATGGLGWKLVGNRARLAGRGGLAA